MLPELKFNSKMMDALIEGRKTVTRRKESKDICNGLYFSAICSGRPERLLLRCSRTFSQKMSDMTEEDAIKEGFTSIDEFRKEIESIYGEEYV